jgi:hypothetical protein
MWHDSFAGQPSLVGWGRSVKAVPGTDIQGREAALWKGVAPHQTLPTGQPLLCLVQRKNSLRPKRNVAWAP